MDFILVPESLILDHSLYEKRILIFAASLFSFRQSGQEILYEVATSAGYDITSNPTRLLFQIDEVMCGLNNTYLKYQELPEIGEPLAQQINTYENFGIIYRSEFDKIIEVRKKLLKSGKQINHAYLLLLLSCLRMIIKDNYSFGYRQIADAIGISQSSASKSLELLEQLEIISSAEIYQIYRYMDS